MTIDSFADDFERAVDDIHRHSWRGEGPSAGTWEATLSAYRSRDQRADAADPLAFGTDRWTAPATALAGEKGRTMSATVLTGSPMERVADRGTPRPSAWLSAALILMLLIGSGGMIWQLQRDGGGNAPRMAIAPPLSTPESTPIVPVPTPGPEYACTAEPLTAEQVMDLVQNPTREYQRRGAPQSEESTGLSEPETLMLYGGVEVDSSWMDAGGGEHATELSQSADTFWNCLMTGTAFQVWSLMAPELVQFEVLRMFPVFRDEASVRAYIEEWGPRRYSAGLGMLFPDFGGVDPVRAARRADDAPMSIRVNNPYDASQPPIFAMVTMLPIEGSGLSALDYNQLYFRTAPDGSWWVIKLGYNEERQRG